MKNFLSTLNKKAIFLGFLIGAAFELVVQSVAGVMLGAKIAAQDPNLSQQAIQAIAMERIAELDYMIPLFIFNLIGSMIMGFFTIKFARKSANFHFKNNLIALFVFVVVLNILISVLTYETSLQSGLAFQIFHYLMIGPFIWFGGLLAKKVHKI